MIDQPAKYDNEDEFDQQERAAELEKKRRSDEFAKMLDESLKGSTKKLAVGDKIRGEILVVGKEEIFVATGTTTDGVVQRRDLLDETGAFPYKTGDQIELYVTQVRGTEIRLSHKPTAKNFADDLEDAFDMMLPVEGRVVELCKGGVRISLLGGKLAFCPISQLDVARTETGEEFVGKKLEFRITQFSEGGRNIVVSRRKLLDEEREVSAGSFLQEHKAGDVVQARVARLEKFGAFAELAPGIDGLIHVSEISWSRVADPAEVLNVGQEVLVKILKIESTEKGPRVSLSMKQAGAEPWEALPERLQAGTVVTGKVTRCMKFGAFVEVAPGVEGLIPLSEMSYTKRVMKSDEFVKEGEKIEVMIKDIDLKAKRISLSLKDAGSDPWALVAQKYPVGMIVTGKIERKESYGLFVKLEDGVTGLLPKSKTVDHPEFAFEKYRINDAVTVQVGELNREERRMSLDVPGDPGRDDWKAHVSGQSSGSFGTLGDQFKNLLEKKSKK